VDDVPPPIVQIGPANQTLPLQSVAMLPCQAIGTPQPRIKWYKNGSPLISQGPRIKVMDSGTLHIDGEDKSMYNLARSLHALLQVCDSFPFLSKWASLVS
jgi:hypothetical protein